MVEVFGKYPNNHFSGALSKYFPADTENGLFEYCPVHSP
jgi:hypothetical protein